MSITRADFERYINNFQFRELFNELGWDPAIKKQAVAVKDDVFELEAVAQKKDFLVFVCSSMCTRSILDYSSGAKLCLERPGALPPSRPIPSPVRQDSLRHSAR